MFNTYSLYTSLKSSILIQWPAADLISGATLLRNDWLFLELTPLLHCLQCQAQTLLWGVEDMQVRQLMQWCCTHNQLQISKLYIYFILHKHQLCSWEYSNWICWIKNHCSLCLWISTSASLLNSWWVPAGSFLTMSLITKWQILTTKC